MSVDRSVAVGIEVTGGQTIVALIDRHGRMVHRTSAKTLQGRSAIATLEPYLRAIEHVCTQARAECLHINGIGISIPGVLDESARCPRVIPTLPALNQLPLCDILEARFSLPTQLHVDVDAALLGEHYFGNGRGFQRLVLLNVQAVAGAALLINGQPERTEQHAIGHVAHIALNSTTTGPRCSCGKRGCINTLLSFDAMQKLVQRAVRRGDESGLTGRLLHHESFTPRLLAEEAAHGDVVALYIYHEMGRWLSAAATYYLDLFSPQMLILGGDLVCTGDFLLTHVRNTLNTLTSSTSARVCSKIEIMPAVLQRDAALLGSVVSFL